MRVMPPTSTTWSIWCVRDLGVASTRRQRLDGALDQIRGPDLELAALERALEVERAARAGGDERKVDLGLERRRELVLGLLGGFAQALQAMRSLRRSMPCLALNSSRELVDDANVEVLAAEVRVAAGRLDAEDALGDLEDRDVEGAAAEVVDGDALGRLLSRP